MTDRALGALSPDVASLLDAFLEREPRAADFAREIEGTVGLARTALAGEAVSSMPAFPIEGLRQIARWRRRARWTGYVTGLAACLLVGLGIGTWMAGAPASPSSPVQIVAAYAGPAQPIVGNVAADRNGFWSAERWRQRAMGSKPANAAGVTWDSPLSPPRKGDAT